MLLEHHLILLAILSLSKHISPLFPWLHWFFSYLRWDSYISFISWSSSMQQWDEVPPGSVGFKLSPLITVCLSNGSHDWDVVYNLHTNDTQKSTFCPYLYSRPRHTVKCWCFSCLSQVFLNPMSKMEFKNQSPKSGLLPVSPALWMVPPTILSQKLIAPYTFLFLIPYSFHPWYLPRSSLNSFWNTSTSLYL